MVQTPNYTSGYYLLGNRILVQAVLIGNQLLSERQFIAIQVIAVPLAAPKLTKGRLLANDYTFYGVTCTAVATPKEFSDMKPRLLDESELETIKLLYSDQSAEGTTVEASQADSSVSDAKSGGGQNVSKT